MSSRPRYADVTSELRERIESGAYPVGSRLPTEAQLTEEFTVSRSTIRLALSAIEEAGLIERRQGSGTTVLARHPPVRYVLSATTEDDILRYATETVLELLGPVSAVPFADGRRLHLGNPDQWIRIHGIRRDRHVGPPLGHTTVFLAERLAGPAKRLGSRTDGALFALIARENGLTVTHIEQEITATLLADDEAEMLAAQAGAPALAVVRRYFSAESGLFEIAENIHPADRFSYALRMERLPSTLT
jgi:DNA-binding GntR family transcriptional regulator